MNSLVDISEKAYFFGFPYEKVRYEFHFACLIGKTG